MNSKLQPITNFDALTDSQRDQLHNWLDEGVATRNIMTKLKDEFGFIAMESASSNRACSSILPITTTPPRTSAPTWTC